MNVGGIYPYVCLCFRFNMNLGIHIESIKSSNLSEEALPDSFLFVWASSHRCIFRFIRVPWLIRCATWLINMNLQMVRSEFTAPSRALVPAAERAIPYSDNTFMCDMTTDSCVTSHVSHKQMSHGSRANLNTNLQMVRSGFTTFSLKLAHSDSCVCHDSLVCATWLIDMNLQMARSGFTAFALKSRHTSRIQMSHGTRANLKMNLNMNLQMARSGFTASTLKLVPAAERPSPHSARAVFALSSVPVCGH